MGPWDRRPWMPWPSGSRPAPTRCCTWSGTARWRAKADKQETTLYLAKPDGAVDPVSGTRLLERLQRLDPRQGFPRFAFLAACESASATAEAAGALGGLAQRLVRELGMPAVVAMTDKVTVATATALAGQFYRRLREHGQPDLALVEATAGLAERGDITVPALYSRLAGARCSATPCARCWI